MIKRKRAPGAGHPRGPTLPPGAPTKTLSQILVTVEMFNFLKSKGVSDYVRAAIAEKMEREKESEK
jgi:hypothetical protein